MTSRQFASYEEMCRAIGAEIAATLAQKPTMSLCIAAGHTSLGVFRALGELVSRGEADFSRAVFVAMDEWLGMRADTPGSCGDLLQRELLGSVPFGRVRLFDGTVEDPQAECEAVEAFLEEASGGALDYLVLGSGMNGHLALNEPSTPFTAGAHVSRLDEVTQRVGQKYFAGQTQLTGGLTLGIGNFARAKRSVLMFSGAHKGEILARTLHEPVGPALPATAVRSFANAAIYYDAEAGAALPAKEG